MRRLYEPFLDLVIFQRSNEVQKKTVFSGVISEAMLLLVIIIFGELVIVIFTPAEPELTEDEKTLRKAYKPNIYLYSNLQIKVTVNIDIKNGSIVESDPEVHSTSSATWELIVSPEGMFYGDEQINWLFYEAIFYEELIVTDFGWSFERQGKNILFFGTWYLYEEFQVVFKDELINTGLYENEAFDFVDWWFGDDFKLFSSDGWFTLQLVCPKWIESHLVLSTVHSFQQLRMFFLCEKITEFREFQELPTKQAGEGNVLHEWGVFL